MTFEQQRDQWLDDIYNYLAIELDNITEYDQYALLQRIDETILTFIRNNYSETYKLPYIGIS